MSKIAAEFLAHSGPEVFNKFLDVLHGRALEKRKLTFWQEQQWQAFTREVPCTYEAVSKALAGAQPVVIRLTREEFLAEPSWHISQARVELPPAAWIAEAWRTQESFRHSIGADLARTVSKLGTFALDSDVYELLPAILTTPEVVALFEVIREQGQRQESEWRASFEAAFPGHTLPPPE